MKTEVLKEKKHSKLLRRNYWKIIKEFFSINMLDAWESDKDYVIIFSSKLYGIPIKSFTKLAIELDKNGNLILSITSTYDTKSIDFQYSEKEAVYIVNSWNANQKLLKAYWDNGLFVTNFYLETPEEISKGFIHNVLMKYLVYSAKFIGYLYRKSIRKIADSCLDNSKISLFGQ